MSSVQLRRRTYDALHDQRRSCGNVVVRAVYAIAVVVDDFIDRIMVDPRLNANPRVDEAPAGTTPLEGPGSARCSRSTRLSEALSYRPSMTAVVPALEAGAAEVCRGILSTLTLFGLFVSARWREIRIWVQRDVGRPNARLQNPIF